MTDKFDINTDNDLQVKERQKVKSPPMYKVSLLNDDYTSMDFVVQVLVNIFRKPLVEATQIMLHVHKNGRGLAGVYAHEIAETKAASVHDLAHQNGFPLKCEVEKE
jgi:ATP-dependent Clp protease adaptor protein ClpS